MTELPGVIRAPNIWDQPEAYEAENRGVDPAGAIESAMAQIHDWAGGHLVDIGCGSGFHLPRWAETAGRVTGVEPHPPLVQAARERIAALEDPAQRQRITVSPGSAQALPVKRADVAHARWAYFFGPGCSPGLAELERVLRPGGTAFIIDHNASRSTFGGWFLRALPSWDPAAVERFWARHGFTRVGLDICWDFPDRETFARVLHVEFAPELAQAILAEHTGASVDYAVNVWWRRY